MAKLELAALITTVDPPPGTGYGAQGGCDRGGHIEAKSDDFHLHYTVTFDRGETLCAKRSNGIGVTSPVECVGGSDHALSTPA